MSIQWKSTTALIPFLLCNAWCTGLNAQNASSALEAYEVKRDRFQLLPESGYGGQIANYPVPDGYPNFESRTRYIGNLSGTWYEMGTQYGRRANDLINNVADYILSRALDVYGVEHLKEDLARYGEAIQDYSPEMIRFMTGIADGASGEFENSSRYPGALTDFERVLLTNVLAETLWMHPPEKFHSGKNTPVADPGALAKMLGEFEDEVQSDPDEDVGRLLCTGMILGGHDQGRLGSATADGETYLTQNMDSEFAPWAWNVAYVATPSDLDAHVYWTINTAGMVGANNTIINWEGLGISHYYGGLSDDDIDFGVPFSPLLTYAGAYGDDLDDAIQILTVGTEEYRRRTGRKTVFRGGPWAFNVGDPDNIGVIEVSAHRYCVRRPGDTGELGNYTVYTNYYQCESYYDEDNQLVRRSMGPDGEEDLRVSIGDQRYYTVDWHIRHHYGDFDLDRVKEAPTIRHAYDKETGRRIDFTVDEQGREIPQWQKFSWSSESKTGGTMHTTVARLRANGQSEMWVTQGRPSEWIGEWQHFDFKGYGK